MIPLSYVAGVKGQVAQFIEGTNGFNSLSTVLKTVAVVTKGSSTITYAASRD